MKFYRKALSCIISAAIGIGTICLPVSAVEYYEENTPITTSQTYGNYTYQTTSKGIIIDSYNGTESTVKIPSQINGTPVYFINDSAFYKNNSIRIVQVPEGVTQIANYAFAYCERLTLVTLPSSLTTLQWNAFTGTACINNQKTPIKYIGTNPFGADTKTWVVACEEDVSSISIDPGAKHIGYNAFDGCYNLTSAVIPSNIISIGACAFMNCTKLKSVTLSEGITTIDRSAFYYCKSLKSITIPASVTYIGDQAFGYTSKDIGNDDTDYNVKISGFTISGYAGTAAETYAKENGFKFINLGAAYTKGDVNQDGKIDISDAIEVLNIYSRNAAGLAVSGYKDMQLKAADANVDGQINIQDASSILSYYSKYAAGLNPVL